MKIEEAYAKAFPRVIIEEVCDKVNKILNKHTLQYKDGILTCSINKKIITFSGFTSYQLKEIISYGPESHFVMQTMRPQIIEYKGLTYYKYHA